MKTCKVSADQAQKVQDIIRRRLCANDIPPSIDGYDKERRQLYDVISRTVSLGESNSVLVIGPRGSGKTVLLKSVLEELRHNEEEGADSSLIKVQLNGLIQTDDRLSLKEITRQMSLDNVVGDRVFGSFSENLQFLLEALKSGTKRSKSVLFILDEFDLFTIHKNQTLLYNLFDVAQSAQAPVCVVGLTARMDVTELLEKRVKSRFSHRQIQLFPSFTFEQYVQVFCTYQSLPAPLSSSSTEISKEYVCLWNERVETLAKEPIVLDVLKRQYQLDADIQSLRMFMLLPVCQVSVDSPYLEASDYVSSYKLHHATDSKAAMLHGVSVLELCLVVAMKHLADIYHNEPFNFEMVFKEYEKFCLRRSAIQIFDKCIVLKAFEHLCALELLRPAEGAGVKTQKEYRLMHLMIDPSEVMEVIQKYPNCPTEVKQWASTSINA